MKYLCMVLLIASPLFAAKCKTCPKLKAENATLSRMVVALTTPTPYKVKTFEDARVRIRYYPDGTFEYEIKPDRLEITVMEIITPKRFKRDQVKTVVKVLKNGDEIKAKINHITIKKGK